MKIKKFENFTIENEIGRIVLTGAPGTGKSSVCEELERRGYKIIEEPARTLIEYLRKNDPKSLPSNDRNKFQELVEEKNVDNFLENKSGFFDRSLVDEIGFRSFYNRDIPDRLIEDCNKYRYDFVFIFPPWKEIFKNDSVRRETYQETSDLHHEIYKSYKSVGYSPIEMPKSDVNSRVDFILKKINKIG
jgi:predicted ATPase